MTEFDNLPHVDYQSYIRWLAKKKESHKHELELLKARELITENVGKRIKYLQEKIKEITRDYQNLDHRN